MPHCLIIDRQTDRQTDNKLSLFFCRIFLYIIRLNKRPPEAGLFRRGITPF